MAKEKFPKDLLVILIVLAAGVVVLIGGIALAIIDTNGRQAAQKVCLEQGGLYIDNRGTDPYCYMKK